MTTPAVMQTSPRLPPELLLRVASHVTSIDEVRSLAHAVAQRPQNCPLSLSVYHAGLPAPLVRCLQFFAPDAQMRRPVPQDERSTRPWVQREMVLGHFERRPKPRPPAAFGLTPNAPSLDSAIAHRPACQMPPALAALWQRERQKFGGSSLCARDAQTMFSLWAHIYSQHQGRAIVWHWLMTLGEHRPTLARSYLLEPWPHLGEDSRLIPLMERAKTLAQPLLMTSMAEGLALSLLRHPEQPIDLFQITCANVLDQQVDAGLTGDREHHPSHEIAAWRVLLGPMQPLWVTATSRAWFEADEAGELAPHPHCSEEYVYAADLRSEARIGRFNMCLTEQDTTALKQVMARRRRDRTCVKLW